jgi:hypothetical protein
MCLLLVKTMSVCDLLFRSFCVYCLMMLLWGCAVDAVPQPAPGRIEPPETFSREEVNWRLEPQPGVKDTHLLSHYFSEHPSLTEGPALQGNPVVYHGTRNRRRYYWIKGETGEWRWSCVQYDGRRFALLEGLGDPFQAHSD